MSFGLDGLVGKTSAAMTEEGLAFFFKKKTQTKPQKFERVPRLQIFPFSITFMLPKTCSAEANGGRTA